jgi:tetratricopeptide (TPR) repeat protein
MQRYPVDEHEIDWLTTHYPHVVDWLRRGETLAVAGDARGALALFDRAAEEYGYSSLVQRRRCEALTVLGRRADAVRACQDSVQNAPSPMSTRALVRAYLAGSEPPSADDLAQALTLVGVARHRNPDDRWAYADLCDVAERIGDEVMLEYCSGELLRVAPADPMTRRILAELRPPWWVGGAWIVLGLAGLGTLVHAVWRTVRRFRVRGQAVALAALALSTPLLCARAAGAEEALSSAPQTAPPRGKDKEDLSELTIDDDLPESNIPGEGARNRNPLQFGYWLQDVAARATKASKAGDHEKAIKYYRALAKAVPDRALAFSRLCVEYDAVGKLDEAIAACATALLRPGVLLDDYARYVHVVLQKTGRLPDKDVATLDDVIDHVRKDPNGDDRVVAELQCDLGVKMNDAARVKECTTTLATIAPNDPKTLTYQWSLAMMQRRYGDAQKLVERVRASDMRPEGFARMERETMDGLSRYRISLVLGGGGGALLILATAIGVAVLRRRPGAPPVPAVATQAS